MESEKNTLYYVIRDLQGTGFGFGVEYTAEGWRKTAQDWADSDGNEGMVEYLETLKTAPEGRIIDTIADFWELEFEPVNQKDYTLYQNEKENGKTDMEFWQWEMVHQEGTQIYNDLIALCREIQKNGDLDLTLRSRASDLLGKYYC